MKVHFKVMYRTGTGNFSQFFTVFLPEKPPSPLPPCGIGFVALLEGRHDLVNFSPQQILVRELFAEFLQAFRTLPHIARLPIGPPSTSSHDSLKEPIENCCGSGSGRIQTLLVGIGYDQIDRIRFWIRIRPKQGLKKN